jgi:hypothetical protein
LTAYKELPALGDSLLLVVGEIAEIGHGQARVAGVDMGDRIGGRAAR